MFKKLSATMLIRVKKILYMNTIFKNFIVDKEVNHTHIGN